MSVLPVDGVYEGEYVNRKRHGKGKCTYSNGNVYEGDWNQGQKHGQGTMKFADGEWYSGEWKNDKQHGQGTFNWPGGTSYSGRWMNGLRQGLGVFRGACKSVYEGEFVANERDGLGGVWKTDGKFIKCGHWQDGWLVEPCAVPISKFPRCAHLSAAAKLGSLLFPDGSYFVGPINAKNQRHGRGKMFSAKGEMIQSGEWREDELHGRKALLFGNTKYDAPVNSLTCPINDAMDMQSALHMLGFACTLLLDGIKRQMTDAITLFLSTLEENDIVFIYFSGHGEESAGVTYLLLKDYKRGTLKHDAVSLNDLMRDLHRKNCELINIIAVDCCRANIDDDTFTNGGEVCRDSASQRWPGLNSDSVRLPNTGSFFIAYPSDPGTVAFEHANERNGYFTGCLLPNLLIPGLHIEQIFKKANAALIIKSSKRQRSWQHTTLAEDVNLCTH